MSGFEEFFTQWLTEISRHPIQLYAGVIFLLVASSFGLPFPEEIVLVTCGLIAGISIAESNESGLPPTINIYTLAGTCFLAVILSDLLVFYLGKKFGMAFFNYPPLRKIFSDKNRTKIENLTKNYGSLACGIFRFTPGLRFPGHFMCGAVNISYTKFILIDGTAALLSVPTQVLLLGFYGNEILVYIKQFKVILFSFLAVALIAWLLFRKFSQKSSQSFPNQSDTAA